jgi:hypothetical protein
VTASKFTAAAEDDMVRHFAGVGEPRSEPRIRPLMRRHLSPSCVPRLFSLLTTMLSPALHILAPADLLHRVLPHRFERR